MAKKSADFEKNVFINCPFDNLYSDLFNAIVFTIHDTGFRPRCALEANNAGQNRLEKLLNIISNCKYSIHDLSRIQHDKSTKLPRFNMPFELGLDLGCKNFGNIHQRQKVILIMDSEPYRYQKFISDLAGHDISPHSNNERKLITTVRNWFNLEIDSHVTIVPSGEMIFDRYQDFKNSLPIICKKLNWNLNDLPYVDFSYCVAEWIAQNSI